MEFEFDLEPSETSNSVVRADFDEEEFNRNFEQHENYLLEMQGQ